MHDDRSRTRVELVTALLGSGSVGGEALAVINRSRRVGADIMDVLAAHHAGDPEHPYRHAAQLLGVRYVPDIAAHIAPLGEIADVDHMAGLRSIRGSLEGRETLFVAPKFGQLALLHAHISGHSEMAERICIISPATLRDGIARTNHAILFSSSIQRLARRFPYGSAHLDLSMAARVGFVAVLALVTVGPVLDIPLVQPVVVALVSLILITPSLFRIWAALTYSRNRPLSSDTLLEDEDLPVYSVLIPLRDEAHMVQQMAKATRALDYPAEKLDIVFVVESESPKTIAAVEALLADARFSLVVVPKCPPYTKPKALNFVLPLARGEHIVVYDAEDVPDPGQLRLAASLFAEDFQLECLQAELLISKSSRGFLAHMFTAEYAGLFGVLLPAIARAGLPTPLGGTSNHFRTQTLRRIGAWDAFNVTEDADLGIRMARLGLKIENFASATWEEAPETASDWIKQRSRWMKGWIQTLLVHSRRPHKLLADLSWRNLFAFYAFVGGMVVSTAIHALFLVATLIVLAIQLSLLGAPSLATLSSFLTLIVGYIGAGAIAVIGLERLRRGGAWLAVIGLPLYWLFAWCALLMALYDLLKRPYHWQKTSHRGFPETGPSTEPVATDTDSADLPDRSVG